MPANDLQISQQEVVFIFTTAVVFLGLLIIFFFIIVINYYRANVKKQQDLLRAIVETQEKERRRIAMDLHDDLGPLLSGVKLQVGSLQSHQADALHATIRDTEDMLDVAITSIRQIIRDLVPRNIEQKGLAGALQDMKVYFESLAPIHIHLVMSHAAERFSLPAEINLYRIIQEIVNNAVKHAEAAEVNIEIKSEAEQLIIEASDTGKGFDEQQVTAGSGLQNIRNRIKLYNGRNRITAAAGAGTYFHISFQKKNLQ